MEELIIMDLSVKVGFVTIHLPDHISSSFLIIQSLAKPLGVLTNKEGSAKT